MEGGRADVWLFGVAEKSLRGGGRGGQVTQCRLRGAKSPLRPQALALQTPMSVPGVMTDMHTDCRRLPITAKDDAWHFHQPSTVSGKLFLPTMKN